MCTLCVLRKSGLNDKPLNKCLNKTCCHIYYYLNSHLYFKSCLLFPQQNVIKLCRIYYIVYYKLRGP